MRQNDFENTPMLKLVMSLAIPSMIAQLVNILYSIVDRMFVGQIEEVGNVCLAAVGMWANRYFIIEFWNTCRYWWFDLAIHVFRTKE